MTLFARLFCLLLPCKLYNLLFILILYRRMLCVLARRIVMILSMSIIYLFVVVFDRCFNSDFWTLSLIFIYIASKVCSVHQSSHHIFCRIVSDIRQLVLSRWWPTRCYWLAQFSWSPQEVTHWLNFGGKSKSSDRVQVGLVPRLVLLLVDCVGAETELKPSSIRLEICTCYLLGWQFVYDFIKLKFIY